MAIELELKLQCVELVSWAELSSALVALSCKPLSESSIKLLENTYYDTRHLALTKQKIALRIRKKILADGAHYTQTLKTAGAGEHGISQRGEWEWELADNIVDIERMASLKEWPVDLSVSELFPVFSADFQRTGQEFNYQGFRFEVVLDSGNLYAENLDTLRTLSEPINEIEVEYLGAANTNFSSAKVSENTESAELEISEIVSTMKEFAERLGALLPVNMANESKAQRGYAMFERLR